MNVPAEVFGMCHGYTPNENQLAAMVALARDIGLHNFQISTVLRKHNAGEPKAAAANFKLWAGPDSAAKRAAEAALYLKEA